MSNKVLIKTNGDDWVEIFIDGDCVWRDHRPPDSPYRLQEFLEQLGIQSDIEEVDEF